MDSLQYIGVLASAIAVITAIGGAYGNYISTRFKVERIGDDVIEAKRHADQELRELRLYIDHSVADVEKRTEEAHSRVSVMAEAHHMLREEIAGKYIDRDRLREFETRIVSTIEGLQRSQSEGLKEINQRLDKLLHSGRQAG